MSLKDVVGQKKISDSLINIIKNGRVAHAYVFSGPKGTGKKNMAVQLAKALNCTEGNYDACDTCSNCLKIEHFNHPGVLYVRPTGKTIKIDQVRQLQKPLNFLAVGVNNKILIIEQAELLTQQAANSLLKFLEEPKANIVVILITENPYQLLSTIRSRCQIINFPELDFNKIKSIYSESEIKENDLLVASYLAEDITKIEDIISTEGFVQMKNLMIQWNKEILTRKYQALFTINDKILKTEYVKENILQFLDSLIIWYRDLLSLKLGRKAYIIYKDYEKELNFQVEKISESQIINQIEEILLTKNKIKYNANLQLSLEQLVLSL